METGIDSLDSFLFIYPSPGVSVCQGAGPGVALSPAVTSFLSFILIYYMNKYK